MAHRAWKLRQDVLDPKRVCATENLARIYENFSGCFAICPLVKGPPKPPAPKLFVMRQLAWLLWYRCMPAFLDPPMDIAWIWKVCVLW